MLILKNLIKKCKKIVKKSIFFVIFVEKRDFLGLEKIKVQKNIFMGNKNYFC